MKERAVCLWVFLLICFKLFYKLETFGNLKEQIQSMGGLSPEGKPLPGVIYLKARLNWSLHPPS